MDWKQYESTALIYFCMANRFKHKLRNEAMVLKEIKETKIGCTFRTIVLVRMSFLKKWSVVKDRGTVLSQIQVQRTGIPKKIRWIQGNKSDSPHLRGKFLIWIAISRGGLISRFVFNFEAYTSTPDGHWPRPTSTDAEDSFFTGAGHVYPHLDDIHAEKLV